MELHHHNRFQKGFGAGIGFSLVLVVLGFFAATPGDVWQGLVTICTQQDTLITDYVEIAGLGATLVNAGLVTLCSLLLVLLVKEPFNGFTVVAIGLMAGFSMFGKNIWNIWPILGGTWLYAKHQSEPFGKYLIPGLMATALAPMVSYMTFGSQYGSVLMGIFVGLLIGFVLPALSAYTFKIQNGMNLYNMGFACGLVAMMLMPILSAVGDKPLSVLHWSTAYNLELGLGTAVFCLTLIFLGFYGTGHVAWSVLAGYRRLLSTTGRVPCDFLRMFGAAPVLVNMGVNGLLATAYILLIGGNLNGATMGGILTIMGFSAFGKHAKNILPVMAGVAFGAAVMHYDINQPSLQLAGLFCTTLAPISGHFGWPFGLLAGFIHSFLVLETSTPVAGVNLYNNGFSGGLVAIVLYPVLTAVVKHRRPVLQEGDYYDLFDDDDPIDTSDWRTFKRKREHLIEMKHLSFGEFDQFFNLLTEGFAQEFYRTYEAQRNLMHDPHYEVYVCRDGKQILGAVALWRVGDYHYVEHLVVGAQGRNSGTGSFMMHWCLTHFGGKFVLEVEPPATSDDKRRVGFYNRLGFHMNSFAYAQPPLREDTVPVALQVMSYPAPLTQIEFEKVKNRLYHLVYGIE